MPCDLGLIPPFVTIDVTRTRNGVQNELLVVEAIAIAFHDAETVESCFIANCQSLPIYRILFPDFLSYLPEHNAIERIHSESALV